MKYRRWSYIMAFMSTWNHRQKCMSNKKPNNAKVFVGPNFHALLMQMRCYKMQGVTDLPPYKNLVPEIPKLGFEEIGKLGSKVVFTFPGCFCFSVVAPLDLELLDGAASSASLCFIQYVDGPLTVGQIRLKVNGMVIDVLVEIRLVWNLEKLPELWYVEHVVHVG